MTQDADFAATEFKRYSVDWFHCSRRLYAGQSLPPSEKVEQVIRRLTRERALTPEAFNALVWKLAYRYSMRASATAKAFGVWCHEPTQEMRRRGHYFRNRWSAKPWLQKAAENEASRQGRAWFFIKDKSDAVVSWRLDQWDSALAEHAQPSKYGFSQPLPYSLLHRCPCGKRYSRFYVYSFARKLEERRHAHLCFPCAMRWHKTDKRERELAELSRDINRLKKEIQHGKQHQNDGATARVSGEHDDRGEERRGKGRRGGADHEAGRADSRVVLLGNQDCESADRSWQRSDRARCAADQPRVME